MRNDYSLLKNTAQAPLGEGTSLPPPMLTSEGEVNTGALALVRVTNVFPQIDADGTVYLDTGLKEKRALKSGFRNTLHFSLNHHVESHAAGNWKASSIVVVAPFDEAYKNMQAKTTRQGLADRTMEGVSLGSLHPVDTWFELGYEAKLALPNASVILPETNDSRIKGQWPKLREGELFRIEGNRTTYKSAAYTTNDFMTVMKDTSALKDQGRLTPAQIQGIVKCVREEPNAKLGAVLRQAGYDRPVVDSVYQTMFTKTKEMATEATLRAKGFEPKPQWKAQAHSWSGDTPQFEKALEATATSLGARYGAAQFHAYTPHSHLEDRINEFVAAHLADPKVVPSSLKRYQSASGVDCEETYASRMQEALNKPGIDSKTQIAALEYLKDRFNVRWTWQQENGRYNAQLTDPPKDQASARPGHQATPGRRHSSAPSCSA